MNVVHGAFISRQVCIECKPESWRAACVRHAGWIGSLLLALAATMTSLWWPDVGTTKLVLLGVWWTALDAVASDLLLQAPPGSKEASSGQLSGGSTLFFCGNFGIIVFGLMDPATRKRVLGLLRKMTEITMMRGAQSGGVVTYLPAPNGHGMRASRSRVVNKKRTDLSKMLTEKLRWDTARRGFLSGPIQAPTLFSGHTRFATSSVANLNGTHPHQWCRPRVYKAWQVTLEGDFTPRASNVEALITHNGDFEFFHVDGSLHPVESVQRWLKLVLQEPMPSGTDSCAIAGLMDLLRTQGVWVTSVRYASLFWAPMPANLDVTRTLDLFEIHQIADIMEKLMTEAVSEIFAVPTTDPSAVQERMTRLRNHMMLAGPLGIRHIVPLREHLMHAHITGLLGSYRGVQGTDVFHCVERSIFNAASAHDALAQPELPEQPDTDAALMAMMATFVETAVNAFFDNDLLFAANYFLRCAKGSFGLCVSSSLDSERQVVIAARGQTMSMAVYPAQGLVLFGSEQAAVKAALTPQVHKPGSNEHLNGAFRIDLDDLGGEIVLLNWAEPLQRPEIMSIAFASAVEHMDFQQACVMESEGRQVVATIVQENLTSVFQKRVVPLQDNEFVQPLPAVSDDPVGLDISNIPKVVRQIQANWASGQHLNNFSSWTFARRLAERVKARLTSEHVADNSVDLLITGQEVSLWAGQQFASDLHMCFPKLRVKSMSANKVLALYGLEFNASAAGYAFHEESQDLKGALVLIVSHSGGTFSSLAVSKLLQSMTTNIFVVAGDWDTQVCRSLRKQSQLMFVSHVMTSEAGILPAEPCSLSLVATHQTLTQLLLYLMRYFSLFVDPEIKEATGAGFYKHDIEEIATMNRINLACLEDIVGVNCMGDVCRSAVSVALRAQGRLWSLHILEAPVSWILSAGYIVATVVSGYPVFYGLFVLAGAEELAAWTWLVRLVLLADCAVYIFLPLWTTILLRLLQGRHWLHRLGTRSLVIGDIPWVSQSLDQFVSKLFARAYSIASINVYNGNPIDHLVHKFTHRVARGTLLAVGRPDGRCNALTGAENAVCLAVNQASSIQHLDVCCESITVGHNNYMLPLSSNHLELRDHGRPLFISERILAKDLDNGISPASILGLLENMKSKDPMGESVSNVDVSSMDAQTVVEQHMHKSRHKVKSGMHPSPSVEEIDNVPEYFEFGEKLRKLFPNDSSIQLMEKQTLPQRMYETRMASLQRCVAFMVLFHEMGRRVQRFWPAVSFGRLRYDMDRTQSIMRIATTASPVSGMDVHAKMLQMAVDKQKANLLSMVIRAVRKWKRFAHHTTHVRMREQLKLLNHNSSLDAVLLPKPKPRLSLTLSLRNTEDASHVDLHSPSNAGSTPWQPYIPKVSSMQQLQKSATPTPSSSVHGLSNFLHLTVGRACPSTSELTGMEATSAGAVSSPLSGNVDSGDNLDQLGGLDHLMATLSYVTAAPSFPVTNLSTSPRQESDMDRTEANKI